MVEPGEHWQQPADGDALVRTAARAYERDRYLTALLAPHTHHADLIALAAFAGEIARIPSFVDEPMMGEIRLQWWRDALAKPAGELTGHPVADAMRGVIARYHLPPAETEAFIDAHARRLDDVPPADDTALAGFLAATETHLFAHAWRIRSGQGAPLPPPIVALAGEAYGYARLLLELPAHLAEGRTLIPASRLEASGVTLDSLRAGAAGAAGEMLLRGLAADTRQRLNNVRAQFRRAEPLARATILPVALIEPYLRALERAGHDPRRVEDVAPFTRVWRLWLAHRLGKL